MTIHWKAVEQYLTVVLFVFQFYSVCNFGKFINFGLDTVRSERFNCFFFSKRKTENLEKFLQTVNDWCKE